VLGKDTIQSANTLNCIGVAYANKRYYLEAMKYFQRCLEIQEKVLGKDAIQTADTLSNIGLVYEKKGKYN
jgi:tetratricopeptide (TPR) repeat protein